MSHYKGTDTSSLAISTAVSGGAVIGGMRVASEGVAEISAAYSDHIRSGGKHIPEVLLVPFAMVILFLVYASVTKAQDLDQFQFAGAVARATPGFFGMVAIGFGILLWYSLVGGLLAVLVRAGQGAVLNAILPLGAVILGVKLGWVGGGLSGFGVWLVARFIVAALGELALYRQMRVVALGIFAFVATSLPVLLTLHWLPHGVVHALARSWS